MVFAQSFRDINSPQYYGKTKIKKAYAVVDANFALIEGGTVDGSFDELTVNNTLTAVSTNDATTNVIITVNGVVDGETLADNSVDSDAMDPSQTAFTLVSNAALVVVAEDLRITDDADVTAELTVGTTVAANSRFLVSGNNATTALAMDYGTGTNGQDAIVFNAAFNSAPVVQVFWTDNGPDAVLSTNGVIVAHTVTATNAIFEASFAAPGVLTNFGWYAIGPR